MNVISQRIHIEDFHVMSYQTNFTSGHTRDRHVGFLFALGGIGKINKMFRYFLFNSYHITKLPTSDKNISTYIRLKSKVQAFSVVFLIPRSTKGNQEILQSRSRASESVSLWERFLM